MTRAARWRSWPGVTFLLALGLVIAAAELAPAQPSSREADLAAIRQRVEELQERLEDIRRRKTGLVGQLVEADYELSLQRERRDEASAELAGARQELELVTRRLDDLQLRLSGVRSALARRVDSLYRLGGRGTIRLLLSVRATDDLLPALRTLRFLVRRDADLRSELSVAQSAVEQEQRALDSRRETVERWLATETERLQDLERARRRRARLLAEVEASERKVASEVADWSERERSLTDLLTRLDEGGAALAGQPIQSYRGVLDRPMTGTVVQGFGPRKDPRYSTLVPHNGLRFAGLEGELVRVVYPGRVLYAESLEGYGPTVIVLHAGRVFTLYAGLAEIAVAKDELLSIGQVVGSANGGLYFELREENRPVDPEGWIR